MKKGLKLQGQMKESRFLRPWNKKKRKTKKNPKTESNENWRYRFTGGGAPRVWYDGNPANVGPLYMKSMEHNARFAIDVYNKTHLKKYSFVELNRVIRQTMTMDLIFNATPKPEEDADAAADDTNPTTFQARVNVIYKYVVYAQLDKDRQNFGKSISDKMKKKKRKHEQFGDSPVLYDLDCTCCDDKTMDILKRSTKLALEVYDETHDVKFILQNLERATGHLSAGSMVDLMFKATPHPLDVPEGDDMSPKTFRARVSITHEYVEFVDFEL